MSQRLVPVFRTLVRALMQQNVTRIWYKGYKDAKPQERCIEPYHLFEADGRWYLIARCHQKQEERVFSLFRTEKAAATEEAFERPAAFNTPEYWEAKARVFGIWAINAKPETKKDATKKDARHLVVAVVPFLTTFRHHESCSIH